jgi:hypothetical protein
MSQLSTLILTAGWLKDPLFSNENTRHSLYKWNFFLQIWYNHQESVNLALILIILKIFTLFRPTL